VVSGQQLYKLVVAYEVTPDHRKNETAVVSDIFTVIQGVEHVAHHRTLAQVFYRHG
jgi:hypothetical protein